MEMIEDRRVVTFTLDSDEKEVLDGNSYKPTTFRPVQVRVRLEAGSLWSVLVVGPLLTKAGAEHQRLQGSWSWDPGFHPKLRVWPPADAPKVALEAVGRVLGSA